MERALTLGAAQERILATVRPLPAEVVALAEARGRVLCEAIESSRQHPPADCSAMDGYAVRAADLDGCGRERPCELPLAFRVAAGAQAPRALREGESARIFTGAPVPEGANAVVRQEEAKEIGDHVLIYRRPEVRENIRDAGEDFRVGDRLLDPGVVIRPPQIGLLASLGRCFVRVHRRPRIAILSGGDELVEPDGEIAGGRIVASNSYTLAAQCREIGAEPIYLGIAEDRPESVAALFRAGLEADCIVSSAGVSVGDHDHVRPVLEKLGCRIEFWGVQMKPGFPAVFGRFETGPGSPGAGGPLVFGLPGNPVSAAVTFEQLVRPALLRMMGHEACFRPVIEAVAAHRMNKKPGRLHFVRVRLERRGEAVFASSAGNQSSGVMHSLCLAQGLLIFPLEASALEAGESVRVQLLDERFLARSDSGL